MFAYMYVSMNVCVCVCVRAREGVGREAHTSSLACAQPFQHWHCFVGARHFQRQQRLRRWLRVGTAVRVRERPKHSVRASTRTDHLQM
jgi:hypothetical protein